MSVRTDKDVILFVDDEELDRRAIAGTLQRDGYKVLCAGNGQAARAILETSEIAVLLLDLMLPGESGLEILAWVRGKYPWLPVIMYTGEGSFDVAVRAVKLGAFDFVEKAGRPERLMVSIRNAVDRLHLEREAANTLTDQSEMIGRSPCMRQLWQTIKRVAPTEAKVLIVGESGTGKELVAQAVYAGSRRSDKTFVKVNCAALPRELVESELFGHRKGAFTGASEDRIGKFKVADKGTLFLDEVGDMDLHVQSKLLRALQSGEIEPVGSPQPLIVDTRIIAATNHDLLQKVKDGSFNEALYYRLEEIVVHLPPLRERLEDIPVLVEHFIRKAAQRHNIATAALDSEAILALQRYAWPGNVRQLEHVIERLSIFAGGIIITRHHVEECLGSVAQEPAALALDYKSAELVFQRDYFLNQLAMHGHNISAVAKATGLAYSTLHPKLKSLGLIGKSDNRPQ